MYAPYCMVLSLLIISLLNLLEMDGSGQNILKINLKEKILLIKNKLGQQYNYFTIYTLLKQQKII